MNRVIAIANEKGGVGKTTTVVNLSASMGARQKRVLLVDLDPQGNAASALGVSADDGLTTYEILMEDGVEARQAVRPTSTPGVSMIPSTPDLSGAQVEMVGLLARETRLRRALQPLLADYDFVFLDTPPSLGLLTLNGLTAAHSVLIPIQCEFLALQGIAQVLETIRGVKQNLNPGLTIEGALLTMYDARTNLSREVMESVVAHFQEKTYKSIIPRNIRLSEAPSHGQPIGVYSPDSVGAQAYEKFADEFLARVQQGAH